MRKVNFILTLMAFGLCLAGALSSCSDKDDEPAVPAAEKIAGSYVGDIDCNVLSMTLNYESLMVKIEAVDDATVVVTIPSFGGNGHNTLPAFDIPDVKVSESDGICDIAPAEFGGTNTAGQAYSGSLQGNLAEGVLTLEFTLHIGAMPMPMTCKFISSGN